MRQLNVCDKNLFIKKYIGNDGIHLNDVGITQFVKHFTEFLNDVYYLDFDDLKRTIIMNESIQKTHSNAIVKWKSNAFVNDYEEKILCISGKEIFLIGTARNYEKVWQEHNCWSGQWNFSQEKIFYYRKIVVSKSRCTEY